MSSQSLGDKLQSLPKPILYGILFVAATIPLFLKISVPNVPLDASIDYYATLMQLPEGSKVLIGSDWTNSTRGESKGQMISTLRILMRKKIKFAVYSTGDGQSPQVARDTIALVSREEGNGTPLYKPYEDYVVLGFYPNSEGTTLQINNNVLGAFAGRKDVSATGPRDVLQSPVFEGVKSLADFKVLILFTASSTNTITLERIKKTPLMFAVTGVMIPENSLYYQSGQLEGFLGGVKGVYDLETLMEKGVNGGGADEVKSPKYGAIPGFPGMKNLGMGTAYYPTLHVCLALLILAVLIGNVGMFMSRRGK